MKILLQIWMQPMYQYINNKDYKIFYFLFAIAPILCLTLTYSRSGLSVESCAYAILIGVGAACAVIIALWFIVMLGFIKPQYSPANVQLIPDYRKKMKLAVGIPILIFSIVITYFFSLSHAVSIGMIWLLCILSLLGVASIIHNHFTVFIFPAVVIISDTASTNSIIQILTKIFQAMDHFWLTMPLGFLFFYLGLNWIFSVKKDQILQQKKDADQLIKQMNNNTTSFDHGIFRKLNLYDLSFKRYTEKSVKTSNLLPLLFGPGIHWSQNLIVNVALFGFFLCYMTVIGLFSDLLTASMFILSLMFVAQIMNFCTALYERKQEQGLVSMTPLVVSNNEMTRLVLKNFLIHCYSMWLINLSLTALICTYTTVAPTFEHLAFLLCFCSLLFIHCLLKNHAKKNQWYEAGFLGTTFFLIAYVGISMALWMRFDQFNIAIPCALLFIIHIGLARHQWLQRLHQNALFPVGRAA